MYDYNQLSCFYPGQDLYEREQLYKSIEPIPLGTKLYRAGDFAGVTELISVGESIWHDQKSCTMFFGSLYFRTFEEAEKVTRKAHANYGSYQQECAEEYFSWRRNRTGR